MPASGLVCRDKPNVRVAPWGLWKGRNRVLRKKLGFVAIRRSLLQVQAAGFVNPAGAARSDF